MTISTKPSETLAKMREDRERKTRPIQPPLTPAETLALRAGIKAVLRYGELLSREVIALCKDRKCDDPEELERRMALAYQRFTDEVQGIVGVAFKKGAKRG
jgi:hypothetical protein